MQLAASSQKPELYTKRCFIKHDIRGKKDMKEEVRSSPVSICCVRPSAAPGRKHHQIRAYILLIKVIAVRHQQIRLAFCQVDSITVVRHLVRGFPQSKTQVSRCFHYTILISNIIHSDDDGHPFSDKTRYDLRVHLRTI